MKAFGGKVVELVKPFNFPEISFSQSLTHKLCARNVSEKHTSFHVSPIDLKLETIGEKSLNHKLSRPFFKIHKNF